MNAGFPSPASLEALIPIRTIVEWDSKERGSERGIVVGHCNGMNVVTNLRTFSTNFLQGLRVAQQPPEDLAKAFHHVLRKHDLVDRGSGCGEMIYVVQDLLAEVSRAQATDASLAQRIQVRIAKLRESMHIAQQCDERAMVHAFRNEIAELKGLLEDTHQVHDACQMRFAYPDTNPVCALPRDHKYHQPGNDEYHHDYVPIAQEPRDKCAEIGHCLSCDGENCTCVHHEPHTIPDEPGFQNWFDSAWPHLGQSTEPKIYQLSDLKKAYDAGEMTQRENPRALGAPHMTITAEQAEGVARAIHFARWPLYEIHYRAWEHAEEAPTARARAMAVFEYLHINVVAATQEQPALEAPRSPAVSSAREQAAPDTLTLGRLRLALAESISDWREAARLRREEAAKWAVKDWRCVSVSHPISEREDAKAEILERCAEAIDRILLGGAQ